jgi:hypothetical protein
LAQDKLDLALTLKCSVGSSSGPGRGKFVSTVISNCIDSGGDGTGISIFLLEEHEVDTVYSVSEKLRGSILDVGQGQRVPRYVREDNIVGELGWLSGYCWSEGNDPSVCVHLGVQAGVLNTGPIVEGFYVVVAGLCRTQSKHKS